MMRSDERIVKIVICINITKDIRGFSQSLQENASTAPALAL
jgi:hypothetical protein